MEPITTLSGYLLSRFLHGIRIVLLTTSTCLFISHTAIAYNIRNKAPTHEDSDTSSSNIIREANNSTGDQTLNHIEYKKTSTYTDKSFLLNDIITNSNSALQGKPTTGDELESASAKLQAYHILDTVGHRVGASASEMKLFCNYYYDKLFGSDVSSFWKEVQNKVISSDADIRNYATQKIAEYVLLFSQFRNIEKEYPNTVNEYNHTPSHTVQTACNPACDNIGFENGNLSAWNAYYAQNTSSTTAFSNTTLTGGACGAVQRSAYDPTTSDYQVAIMSGTGTDPVAGSLIPLVCPTGGSYSCRIGDSTRNGAQMGFLQQTFTVTNANANFVYMYAVVLENPGHAYYQQPYFNVQMLDQSGNTIPGCGDYSVVSAPGLPGYKAIYYSKDADTVYCKPWTTVFVPLQAYIGQCITIQVTVSDCELGGHFGYAYFDASCIAGIITSLPTLCSNVATLTANAPAGASSYTWSGPCIVGPIHNQSIMVSCPGIYKVAIESVIGSGCADTIADTVTGSMVPAVSTNQSLTNVSCSGGNNGTATAAASGGRPPYSYSWGPVGGTNATASNLIAGNYQVIVTDANGCSDTAAVKISQPTPLTVTANPVTNVSCNGGNNGIASVAASGGTPSYIYSWAPGGATSSSANNLSAGTYTINITDSNGCKNSTTTSITQPTIVTSTISSANVTCNGGNNGNATVIASGGISPYKYSWAPIAGTSSSVSNLSTGSYSVTVTDANSCVITSTAIITQPIAITTSAFSSSVSCYGGNNGSATVIANGGTPPYLYSWAPNSGSSSIANNIAAGTYTVTTTDANGCKNLSTISVMQPTALASSPLSANVSCNGGNNGSGKVVVTGGVSPYTYSWTPSVSSNDSAKNITAGNYSITITDARNCITTTTLSVSQPTAVTAAAGTVSNVLCNGGSNGSSSVVAAGGIAPYSYSWAPQGGKNSSATNLAAGTYTVTITDSHNCPATISTTISQPSPLNLSVNSITDVSCYGGNNGGSVVNTTGGTPAYKYSWAPNNSATNSANNLSAGTYTVTITDANNCITDKTVTITQPTQLISKVTSTKNISCNGGNNGNITISATGGTPNYLYNWSPAVSTNTNASNLTSGNYTITITDANGCTSKVSTTLSQPQPIITTTSVQQPACYGLTNGSAKVNVSGGTPSYNYVWNTVPQQYSQTANNIGAGAYTVLITDANNCSKIDTVKVSQPFALQASIVNSTNPICYGDSTGTATVYVTGGTLPYAYLWNTSPKQTTYNASKLSAGTYSVNVIDNHNCPISTQVTLTQPTPVVTQASAPDSVCSGTTVTITASGNGGSGSYHYIWSTGTGSIATQNVSPTNSTTYSVTAVDGNGCKGIPASVTINTWNLGPGSLLVTPPQTICFGDTVVLSANITNSNSGSTNIHWSSGFIGSGPFSIIPSSDTIFTVTAMNQCGNSTSKNITVTVNPLPKIEIPVQTSASCGGVTFTYHDSLAANIGDSYLWNFGDGASGSTNPISHSYTVSGTYNVTVVITSLQGCKNSAAAPANVTVYTTAKAHFTPDPKVAPISEPTIYFSNNSTSANAWKWNFGDENTTSYSEAKSPVHTYADTGSFIVHLFANNSFGCPDTAIDTVRILPEFTFYVPNAFSPNGDGLNDVFTGKGIGIVEYDMVIFDRWGMQLFETNDLYKGWDGRVDGGSKIAQEDTYVYVIKLTDIFKQKHSYIGSVTIIK